MKIIDLLNMISKGEEVPKKVSINAGIHGVDTWVYDEHYEDYKNGANIYLLDSGMTTNHLNDEVEIIEEDNNKIEKMKIDRVEDAEHLRFKEKINEIIDKINNMEEIQWKIILKKYMIK